MSSGISVGRKLLGLWLCGRTGEAQYFHFYLGLGDGLFRVMFRVVVRVIGRWLLVADLQVVGDDCDDVDDGGRLSIM